MIETNKKLVSIIIPIYNADKYLSQCIDSLLNQTYTDLEIILVDDGSTDLSSKICDEYKKNDSRIVVVHKKNAGVSSARNTGLEFAKGKYVYFCDSDDYLDQSLINTFVKYQALNKDSKLIVCNYNEFSQEGIVQKNISNLFGNVNKSNLFISLRGNGYLWNKFFLRDIIMKNNLFFDEEISILEDQIFIYKYCKYVNGLDFITDRLYFYRQHSLSAMNKINSKNVLSSLIARYKIFLFFKNDNIDLEMEVLTWNDAILRFLGIRKDCFFKKVKFSKKEEQVMYDIGRKLNNETYKKNNWRILDYFYYIVFKA